MKLEELEAYEAVPVLMELLASPEYNIRMLAVEALGCLGEEKVDRVGPALIKMLTDPEELVRAEAVDALARLHHKPAKQSIINLLRDDSDWLVPASAAEALPDVAEVGDPEVLAELESAMNDTIEPVCSYAACSIGLLGTPETLPTLRVYLMSEPCLSTKAELLAARYRLGDRNDLSRLLQLLDNAQEHLISVVLNILADIVEREVPENLAADAYRIRASLVKVTQSFPSYLNHVDQIIAQLEEVENPKRT